MSVKSTTEQQAISVNRYFCDICQKKLMRPSTLAFAEKRCAENRERIEREAKGDYGVPILLIL